MTDKPTIAPEQFMRSLADAVDKQRPKGGVRFQPIFPDTLRFWADNLEQRLAEKDAEIARLEAFEHFAFRVLHCVASEEEVNPNDLMAALLHLSEENRAALYDVEKLPRN